MRLFVCSVMAVCALSLGCNKPVETIPSVAPSSSGTTVEDSHADHDHAEGERHDDDKAGEDKEEAAQADPSAAKGQPEAIRFVADKRINVPSMMCPYSCWPTVQETLASQPGVEGVQLAQQPQGAAEGEIVERVVELKLNGDFDADAAIAALAKVNFKAEVAN